MATPSTVRADEQLRGDPWALQINLPAETTGSAPLDWSGSTLTVESDGQSAYPITIDQSHLGDEQPFAVLHLTGEATAAISGTSVTWLLSESPLIGRGILRSSIVFTRRLGSSGDGDPGMTVVDVVVDDALHVVSVSVGDPAGPPGPRGADGEGVPAGGQLHQVLRKASTDDYDTEWAAETGGGANLPADATGWLHDDGTGALSWSTPTAAQVGAATPSAVSTAVAGETDRATATEAVIATGLAAETTRAEAAESALSTTLAGKAATSALAAEVTRATAAEGTNADAVAAEVTRAEGAEATLTSAITAEATARSNADAAEVIARNAAIATAVAGVLGGAPGALDTLKELADAINDDASFAASVTTTLAGKQPIDADLTAIAALSTTAFGRAFLTMADAAATKTALALVKGDVGLGSVDNTSDAGKPVSTAQQTALDGKQPLDSDLTTIAALDASSAGAMATDGSGWVRKTYAQLKTALSLVKADVGLGNVDNTSDANKPVSTAQATVNTAVQTAAASDATTKVAAEATARTAAIAAQHTADNAAYALVPTSTKTAAYAAAAGELVLVDVTGRTVTDGTLAAGSATLTSPTAAFTSADIGKTVYALNVPIGTTITAVASGTSATMSANALAAITNTAIVTINGSAPVTLPASAAAGAVVEVKKVDSTPNAAAVVPNGSDDIDGVAQVKFTQPGATRRFVKGTGTSWTVDGGLTPTTGPGSARYDRRLNLYLPGDGSLDNLIAALGRARNGGTPARLLCRGDSTTLGVIGGGGNGSAAPYNPLSLTESRAISWPDKARKMLNTSLALGGTVAESITNSTNDSRFTFGTGWTSGNSILAPSTATGTMTFADDNQANAWDITVLRQSNATTFTVTVDGGAAQTFDTSTVTSNKPITFRATAGSVGTHTLVFSAPAAGTVQFLQIEPVNTGAMPVLRMQRYGISGQQLVTGLNPSSSGVGSNMFPHLMSGVDAVILLMGVNDMHFWTSGNGTPAAGAAAYKAALVAFCTAFRAAGADPILTVFPSRGYAAQNPGDYEALLWQQQIYDTADQMNVAVLDLQRRWGYGPQPINYTAYSAGNLTVTPTPMYDSPHPTLAGYYDIGRMVANFLAAV